MDTTTALGLALGLGLVIVIALIIWRTQARRSNLPDQMPESLEQVADARLEPDEAAASLVSEQIEEMVRKELAQHADLADRSPDFGTAADGSLEIWFDGQRYSEPAQVPDQRVRSAIERAVQTFNR